MKLLLSYCSKHYSTDSYLKVIVKNVCKSYGRLVTGKILNEMHILPWHNEATTILAIHAIKSSDYISFFEPRYMRATFVHWFQCVV